MGKPTGKGWIGNVITGYQKTPTGDIFQIGDPVYLDFTKTFIGFIGGTRGSGKSYTANVIIEEILKQNPTWGIIAIDKPGLYFSLKYPNTNTEEFRGWDDKVKPRSYADRIRVLVPIGWKKYYPERTYDGEIGIRPSQLTSQNWFDCLQIEATKPQGIILSIFLKKMKKLNPNFTIEQLVRLVDRVVEVEQNPDEAEDDVAMDVLNEITFRKSSIEALQSKLMAATTWGIFSSKSMDIFDLCKSGMLTIIDISWWQIPHQVGALLVAFLTEQLFGLRMMKSQEAMHAAVGEEVKYLKSEKEIPPPVLVVEEAQNYLARKSSDNTFSVRSLRRYVRQGRQAGCSLISITQQPQAIDTGPLSQVNWVLQFQITHEADFKAVKNIMPCDLPRKWKSNLRALRVGEALVAFTGEMHYRKIKIRPRETIHLARTTTTDLFELREEYAKTESDTLTPIEPPVVLTTAAEGGEVGRLLKENMALQHQFQAMKSEKNDLIKEKDETLGQKEDLISQLTEKVTALQQVVDKEVTLERHGVILAKFDDDRGYIADCEATSGHIDPKLLQDITRSAIGFGEQLSTLNFKLEREVDYFCFSKRFQKENKDSRGGAVLYALVIFSTDEQNDFSESLLSRIVKEILDDWRNRTTIVDKYFSQLFFSVHELRKGIKLYKMELENARRRIKTLVERNKKRNNKLKEKVKTLEKEKHTLAMQIDNISNVFDLEKPEVRAILMEEKFEEIKKLSTELDDINAILQEERARHTDELEKAKAVILQLDREVERAEEEAEERVFEDLEIENRLRALRGDRTPQLQLQSQAQMVESAEGDIVEYLESTGLRPYIDQLFQEEREKHIKKERELEEAIKTYKNGLLKIRKNINDLKHRNHVKLLESEKKAIEYLKRIKGLEKEISLLEETVRDLRPKPIETIPPEERDQLFTETIVPKEVARALNRDVYPEQVKDIAQGIKKRIVDLKPLSFKILTILETIDTWVTIKNLNLIILGWKDSAIRKHLKKLVKHNLIRQKKQGNKYLYRTNLRQLVQQTFLPYKSVLTGLQIDTLFMEIRNCLPITLLPRPSSNNHTIETFLQQEGEFNPATGEME